MSKLSKILILFLYIVPTVFLLYTLSNSLFFKKTKTVVSYIDNQHQPITDSSSINKETKIIFTGDVMLGRTVMTKSIEKGNWKYPVENISEKISDADITFINLENPVVQNCPEHYSGFKFCSPPESLQALKTLGVDIMTLANNHTLNYGQRGLEETLSYLANNDIKAVGTGELEVVEFNDNKFGFLGFDLVTNNLSDLMTSIISDSDSKVDFLIVGVHWGAEYQPSGGVMQRDWAKEMVKAGADLIIGHHPHWVQDAECIDKDNLQPVSQINREELLTPGSFAEICLANSVRVYYSLGNFVFDQMWSEETRRGLAVEITLEDNKIIREHMLPVYMHNWAQPEWVEQY